MHVRRARKQLQEKERKAGDDMSNLRKEMQRCGDVEKRLLNAVVSAAFLLPGLRLGGGPSAGEQTFLLKARAASSDLRGSHSYRDTFKYCRSITPSRRAALTTRRTHHPRSFRRLAFAYIYFCFLVSRCFDVPTRRGCMYRLQETICSQADRVVAASKSEQVAAAVGDVSGQAMVIAQGMYHNVRAYFVLCTAVTRCVYSHE